MRPQSKKPPAVEPESRARILDAAEELFASRGFGATSTRLIARQAKVNIALLYYYFESKSGLYGALIERYTQQLAGAVEQALADREPLAGRIEKGIDALFDALLKNTRVLRILLRELLAGQPSVHVTAAQAYLRALFAAGQAMLERGAETGLIARDLDAPMFLLHLYAASAFYFGAHGSFQLLVGGDPLAPEQVERARREIKAIVLARLGLKS